MSIVKSGLGAVISMIGIILLAHAVSTPGITHGSQTVCILIGSFLYALAWINLK